MYLDSTRMFNWQSLIFLLPGLLAYTWPANQANKENKELFPLGMHNCSEWTMALWQDNSHKQTSFCLLWLKELQSSQCPFLKLLIHCLIALPVYNLLLILIGWHLNRSTSKTAERMLLGLKPDRRRPAPAPPLITAPTPPPLPPPRQKRYTAPKPPTRRMPGTVNTIEKYPNQKDPFASVEQSEQYKSLRRNLVRVLAGLQQPLSQLPLPLPMPMPVTTPRQQSLYSTEDNNQSASSVQSKHKKKPRQWIHVVVKRLGKTFGKSSNSHKQLEDNEVNTSSGSGSSSNRSNNVIQMGWQRLRDRANRRTQFYVPSESSSETISSSSCIYAY